MFTEINMLQLNSIIYKTHKINYRKKYNPEFDYNYFLNMAKFFDF